MMSVRGVPLIVTLVVASGLAQPGIGSREGFGRGADEFFGRPSFAMRSFAFPGDGQTNIEVRLSMIYDLLQFVKEAPDRYRAGYEITAAIVDPKGNEVAGRILRNHIVVSRYEETNSRLLAREEKISLNVPAADYTLTLDLMDLDTQKHLRREEEIKAADFVAGQLQVSSLAFVDYVKPAAVRDSLHFSLTATFRPRRELQGVYFELAGIAGDSATVQYTIRNHRDEEVGVWSEKLAASTNAHLVDMERWLKTPGQYTLEVKVSDKIADRTRKEPFTVMSSALANGSHPPAAPSGLYEPLRYIAKGGEYKRIAAAAESQRDSLIAEFWKQRDPTPDTPENELLEEYNRRLDFAIASFSVESLGKAGWQTDRGRIYLQNGQPTDVQRQMPSMRDNGARYEIWYYKSLDRSYIFRERLGTGDYDLVGQQ
jgi:GWxTD domain-containing protein